MGRLSLVLGLGVALGACSTDAPLLEGGLLIDTGGLFTSSEEPQTLFGSYLAGRHAGAQLETGDAARFYRKALAEDPENFVILERAFLLDLSDGNVGRAAGLAERIVEREPSHRMARLVLGLRDIKSANYEGALENLKLGGPGPFSALISTLMEAYAHQGLGDTDEAVKVLKSFDDRPAFRLFHEFHAGIINDLAGRIDAAGEAYGEAMKASAGASIRVVEAYGRFLERTGRADEARNIYANLNQVNPDHPVISVSVARVLAGKVPGPMVANVQEGAAEALYGLASALSQERSLEVAIIYLRLTLYMRPDFPIAQTLLADLFDTAGRYEEALSIYRRVDPDSPFGHNANIQYALLLDRLDRTGEGIARLRFMIKRDPEDKDAIIALADMLRADEQYEEAAKYYTMALDLSDTPTHRDWSLYYTRGMSLERAGQWEAAERDLKMALTLEPDHPLVLNYLGYSWIDQGINLDDALAMIEKAVELRPNDGYIVDSLGWAYYKLGDYQSAVDYLERAVELQPGDPTINDHLGDAYWQVGERILARYQWDHVLGLDPDEEVRALVNEKLRFGLRKSAPEVPPESGTEPLAAPADTSSGPGAGAGGATPLGRLSGR